MGPSAPSPIAGGIDGPRSRSAEKSSERSAPSKARTSFGPTTTIVPSSATIGAESPPVTSAWSIVMSSWRHATSRGAEGPSERPPCDGPPWNCGQSASAASGMPNTMTSVSQATVMEWRGAPERWEARKARHPSRSTAAGCSGCERREPDEPPDLDGTEVRERIDVDIQRVAPPSAGGARARRRVRSPSVRSPAPA